MDNEGTHISVPRDVPEASADNPKGKEPMTASQASQLKTLAAEAGVPVDLELNRDQAAKKISELQGKSARGGSKDS